MNETRTFRVFVSSTFKDLAAERNHLSEHVYPVLRELCEEHGARFQPIDLRWGVSREASLDQQAMNVCLEEIDRCREVTPRPNFIVLLGNRHGWLAPPPQITAAEYDTIRGNVPDPADGELLDTWYACDTNAVPPEYYLRPRTGQHKRDDVWAPVEARLHALLAAAAARTQYRDDPKYRASATEQEILRGALGMGRLEGRSFCFVREIVDHPDPVQSPDGSPVLDFVDRDQAPLDALKARLRSEVPYKEYAARWDAGRNGPGTEHLEALARDVREALTDAILGQLEDPVAPERGSDDVERIASEPALDIEGRAHRAFAEERCKIFVGRQAELAAISAYLDSDDRQPLVIAGGGGTGKSALLAEAVRRAQLDHPDEPVVYRFIGATASSSNAGSLLHGVCAELARRAGDGETAIPNDYQGLVTDFRDRLVTMGADRRLLLFFDSLDQLSPSDGARSLAWLPVVVPAGVRVVVSTRPEDTLAPLQKRHAPITELGPMSETDGTDLLTRWLADAHRTLKCEQQEEVLTRFSESDGNPLYLRLAFQEARRWRSDQAQEHLAGGVEGIIATNTFGRLADEENHGAVLVSRALGYLAASRYGLAEDELLDVLSRDMDVYEWFLRGAQHVPPDLLARARDVRAAEPDIAAWLETLRTQDGASARRAFLATVLPHRNGPRLPVVLWSRLASDLRPYLTEREADGAALITFFHRELGDVARREFLGERERDYHTALAGYFAPERGADDRPNWRDAAVRGLSELPHHLIEAQQWQQVEATLTDFAFLEAKVARVAVEERTDAEGKVARTYRGVQRLQDDFDEALQAMSGDEAPDRPRLIVTATDFGGGLVVRCPHCNVPHAFDGTCASCGAPHALGEWLGHDLACSNPACGGPLRVNRFVAGPTAAHPGAGTTAAANPPVTTTVTTTAMKGEPAPGVTAPENGELPLTSGAARLVREAEPGGLAGVNHWLVAVLRRFGPMAEQMSPGLDARALAAEVAHDVQDGRTGEPMSPQAFVDAAAQHARERGVERVAERDLVAAALTAAGRAVAERPP